MNTKARTLETLAEVGLGPGVMVCDEMCAFVRPHGDPTTAVCMFVMFFVPKEREHSSTSMGGLGTEHAKSEARGIYKPPFG